MSRRLVSAITAVALVALLSACAAGPNELVGTPAPDGTLAGFWQGLWQGFIAFFTFVVSLFKHDVRIYEVHNNGAWYDLGFLLGVMAFFGGGGGAKRRSRRRCSPRR